MVLSSAMRKQIVIPCVSSSVENTQNFAVKNDLSDAVTSPLFSIAQSFVVVIQKYEIGINTRWSISNRLVDRIIEITVAALSKNTP